MLRTFLSLSSFSFLCSFLLRSLGSFLLAAFASYLLLYKLTLFCGYIDLISPDPVPPSLPTFYLVFFVQYLTLPRLKLYPPSFSRLDTYKERISVPHIQFVYSVYSEWGRR
ncbi:hypothetical protein K438DRAFT_545706 [Mycena galopus ATCC 62051]|nr:hypothetical protein K438DRAFT_545706 [Mycena galopus ATCC 62051]